MTDYLSNKIRVISALSILMVIYIHMYYTEGLTMPTLSFIETVIGQGICSVAVPMFYIISGYLFFLSVPDGFRSISKKLRKRCRTLLVPYLLANILTFTFYVVLNAIALKVTMVDRLVNFKIFETISADGLWGTFNLVFISPPIAFQLWFVRDLMVVMLFSPIIWVLFNRILIFRKLRMAIPISLMLCFIAWGDNGYVSAFVWFLIGTYLAMLGILVELKCGCNWIVGLIITYLTLAILLGCHILPNALARYIPFVGIPAVWLLYDKIIRAQSASSLMGKYIGYTFFVYLVHEPILNIFKKLPLLISRSETMLICCYLVVPIIFFWVACLLGRMLKQWIPNVYYIYTGGR